LASEVPIIELLVAPFKQSVSKGERWYLIYRAARKDQAAFQSFRAWITHAAAKA
jgi:LysR family glycine cleavage system transcriptional activator